MRPVSDLYDSSDDVCNPAGIRRQRSIVNDATVNLKSLPKWSSIIRCRKYPPETDLYMTRLTTPLKAIRHGLPRQYARVRLGVTKEEARAYNRTSRILLTFDDYGTPEDVRKIMDILEGERIKGMFFLQGDWCDKNTGLVKEIAARGHWLGSHTYSHAQLDKLSDEAIRSELHRGLQTDLLRPPYGAYNDHVRKLAAQLGFKIAFWTIDSHDWHGISAAEIQKLILPRLHQGACILMHLNAPHTIEALPGLIAGIKAHGFELCQDGTEIQINA